jgi:hypothetical protein
MSMLKQILSGAALACAALVLGMGAAAADRTGPAVIRSAELTPRGATPATPLRPSSTSSANTLAAINRRLAAMQREINQLKADVSQLRQKPMRSGGGGGGNSIHSADEAYTMAAEARDIAQRAEQKADQALAAASSH